MEINDCIKCGNKAFVFCGDHDNDHDMHSVDCKGHPMSLHGKDLR